MLVGCTDKETLHKSTDIASLVFHQWHLENSGQTAGAANGGTPGEDLRMGDVWEHYTGGGVQIAVIDTGADSLHYDLTPNLSTLSGYYSGGVFKQSSDGRILTDDQLNSYKGFNFAHGTACAGIAAAADNGIGVTGVAPTAQIIALNAFADTTAYAVYSFKHALYHTGTAADISSNSWNDGIGVISDGDPEIVAIKEGVTNGREGRGIVYCFAAGNERDYIDDNPAKSDNANWHRELNTPYVVTVAALNADGRYSSYSNFGANILVSAFGGEFGILKPAIVTTDLIGNYGYDSRDPEYYQYHFDVTGNGDGDYTNVMNGTSAAAPMVAGVAALMLDANPNLTYRDVRYLLATNARKNDPLDPDWTQNGAGHWINPNYGFGAVDVNATVANSRIHAPLAEQKAPLALSSGSLAGGADLNITITYDSNGSYHKVGSLTVGEGENRILEFVEIGIDLLHGVPGDLDIILESPAETNATLSHHVVLNHPINSDNEFFAPFTFGSVGYLDENSTGIWNLYIRDFYDRPEIADDGLFDGWKLTFYGR
jgi:subtilisin family serine protease